MHPRGVSMRVYGLANPGPGMRIETWCEHCGKMLTSNPFNVSEPLPDGQPAIIGEEDAAVALAHLEREHGL